MSLLPRLQEWIQFFYSHMLNEQAADDNYIQETSFEITSELEHIMNHMLLDVPYCDWVDSFCHSPPEYTRCAKEFIDAVHHCRKMRLLVTGPIASAKIKYLQRNLVGGNPFGSWIVAEREVDVDPSRIFSVLRNPQHTEATRQMLFEIYNKMSGLQRIDWNHFLEPQAPASNKCMIAWIEDLSPPWNVRVDFCDLESDISPFQDIPGVKGLWSKLVEGCAVLRKSKYTLFDNQVWLILRLNIWESAFLENLRHFDSAGSLLLLWLFVAYWTGDTSSSIRSCTQKFVQIVNEHRYNESSEVSVSKDDGLPYPYQLHGYIQLLETELGGERPLTHVFRLLLAVLHPTRAAQ